jgi:hypothetical protein
MATTTEELRARNSAIERGLDFIYRFGTTQKCFADYGSFLICCFALVAATSRDPKLRSLGRERAKQLLRRWSDTHPSMPADASSDLLLEFVLVQYAQRRIGLRDRAGETSVRLTARNFSAFDLLGLTLAIARFRIRVDARLVSNASAACESAAAIKYGWKRWPTRMWPNDPEWFSGPAMQTC